MTDDKKLLKVSSFIAAILLFDADQHYFFRTNNFFSFLELFRDNRINFKKYIFPIIAVPRFESFFFFRAIPALSSSHPFSRSWQTFCFSDFSFQRVYPLVPLGYTDTFVQKFCNRWLIRSEDNGNARAKGEGAGVKKKSNNTAT